MWTEEYELLDESYYVSHIQDNFLFLIKKSHQELTYNPQPH